MKKILLLTISILMVTAAFAKFVKAGNPIPSYNVPVVNKAYFQEAGSTINNGFPCDEKRDMNVSNEGSAGGNRPESSDITIYVYRLDQSIILGPFVIPAGRTITVGIDRNQWGVVVNAELPTLMSVWVGGNQIQNQ